MLLALRETICKQKQIFLQKDLKLLYTIQYITEPRSA